MVDFIRIIGFYVLTGGIVLAWVGFLSSQTKLLVREQWLAALLLTIVGTIVGVQLLGNLQVLYISWLVPWQLLIISSLFIFGKIRWRTYQQWFRWRTFFIFLPFFIIFSSWLWLIDRSDEISFDALNYHLPWSALALQEHGIYFFSSSIPWITVYPKLIESWQLWHLAGLGSSRFVDASNIWFVTLAGLALWNISRHLKLSRLASWFAVVSYIIVPLNLWQARTNYIDLSLAALVLTLLYWSLTARRRQTMIIWGLTAVLLAGSKITGIPWVVLALGILLARRKELTLPKQDYYIGAFVMVLFTLPWYIRQWVVFGSPLYPLGLRWGQWQIFTGLELSELLNKSQAVILQSQSYWQRIITNLGAWNEVNSYQMNPGGWGVVGLFLLIPVLLFMLVLWRRKKPSQTWILSVIFLLGLFFLTPANWWLRYVLATMAVGSLALGWLIDYSQGRWKKLLVAFSVVIIILSVWQSRNAFAVYQQEQLFPELIDISLVTAAKTTVSYDQRWQLLFPLWNGELTNRVVFVPLKASASWWLDLKEDKVDYLVTKYPSPELDYIFQHPDQFKLLRQNEQVGFWEVL